MRQVRSAAPVAPWMGGKSKLNKKIIEKIDVIPHKAYVEPFVGMGGVFLRRGFQPRLEVANDLNGEIINLFRILQRHYPQLMEVMRFQITSRREFERLRNQNPDYLTDLGAANSDASYGNARIRGICGFSKSVTEALTALNAVNITDKTIKQIMAEVQAGGGFTCSAQSKNKGNLKFPYHSGNGDKNLNCEFHVKIHRDNTDDGVHYQDRIYFGLCDTPSGKKIFVAHSGIHL